MQVVVKSALFVFPLVLKSQVAIDDGQAVAAGFGGDGCLAPEFVLGLPEEVAFGVEQFLGGAEVVGDQGMEGSLPGGGNRLFGNGVEGARLEVPAADFVGIVVRSVFFGQGGALPEVADAAFPA